MNSIKLNKKRDYIIEISVCVLVMITVRASAIFSENFASDDYNMAYTNINEFIFWMRQGRIPLYIINLLAEQMGANFPFLGALWSILSCTAYVIIGFALRLFYTPDSKLLEGTITTLIFSLFPYHSDLLSYHVCAPWITVTLCLAAIALIKCDKCKYCSALALVSLIFATSYQPFTLMFASAITIAIILKKIKEESIKTPIFRLNLLGFAIIANLIIMYLSVIITGEQLQQRTSIIKIDGFLNRFSSVLNQWINFLFKEEPSISSFAKIIQIILISFFILGLVFKLANSKNTTVYRIRKLLFIMTLFSISLLLPVFPYVILGNNGNFLTMRMMCGWGAVWSGVFVAAISVNHGISKKIVISCGILLCISYAFNVNNQCSDLVRLHVRDRLVANSIFERLSEQKNFNKVRTVVVVSKNHKDNGLNIRTSELGFGDSVLVYQWSVNPILSETSGFLFEAPSKRDVDTAYSSAKDIPKWPDPRSIYIVNDIGVVVFN